MIRKTFNPLSILFSLIGCFGLWKLHAIRAAIDKKNTVDIKRLDRVFSDISIGETNIIVFSAFAGLLGLFFGYAGVTSQNNVENKFNLPVIILSVVYILGIILLFYKDFLVAQ